MLLAWLPVLVPAGIRQDLCPEVLSARLHVGTTLQEVESMVIGLGSTGWTRGARPRRQPDGTVAWTITEAGWGSALAVQHQVTLYFAADGTLERGDVEYCFQAGEEHVALELKPGH